MGTIEFEYWERRLAENPGLTGVGYLALGENYNKWLYRIRKRVFFRYCRSLNMDWNRANVLDIGSGTGFYVRLWEQLGVRDVSGSDLTEFAVCRLRKVFPGRRIHKFDIGSHPLSVEAGHYDAASAFDVLFHVVCDDRFARAIENVYRLLAPGGFFLFSDNFLHFQERRHQHQVHRNLDRVVEVLQNAGFKIVTRKPVFVLMNQPVDTRSNAIRFLWKLVMAPVRRSEWAGLVIGGLVFPLELLLTRFLDESPTTEIMICQKPMASTEDGERARGAP